VFAKYLDCFRAQHNCAFAQTSFGACKFDAIAFWPEKLPLDLECLSVPPL